ncbi:uncharacterized protein LOC128958215 [Oppia nitens]|uniref:uncharacterized protein LOC128958215 n=1 Tax=Oppia nitens TaxID=1686743 RepID=UPI0023DC6547|nr:uncharacterized protein LOC128958215 [Oppia nitens]
MNDSNHLSSTQHLADSMDTITPIGDIDGGNNDCQLPEDELLARMLATHRKLKDSIETMATRVRQLKLQDIDNRTKLANKWCELYKNLLHTYGQCMQNECNRYLNHEDMAYRLRPLVEQLTIATDWFKRQKKYIRQQTAILKRRVNETTDGVVDFTDIDNDLDVLFDRTAVPDLPNVLKFYQSIIDEFVPKIAIQTQDIVVNVVEDTLECESNDNMNTKTVINITDNPVNSHPVNDISPVKNISPDIRLIDNNKPIDYMIDTKPSMTKTDDDNNNIDERQEVTNTKTPAIRSLLTIVTTNGDNTEQMKLSLNCEIDPIDDKMNVNENSEYIIDGKLNELIAKTLTEIKVLPKTECERKLYVSLSEKGRQVMACLKNRYPKLSIEIIGDAMKRTEKCYDFSVLNVAEIVAKVNDSIDSRLASNLMPDDWIESLLDIWYERNGTDCTICSHRVTYDPNDSLKTCCGHWFHIQCIDEYLRCDGQQLICPQCQRLL